MQRRGRSPRPPWLAAGLSLILAVIAMGSAGAYQVARIPAVAEQVPANAAPLVVAVGKPVDGSVYPENAFIPIVAQAVAARPLAALELWADGVPVRRQQVQAGSTRKQLAGFWSWQPATRGEHTLVVRAVDQAGIVGQSTPVRVRATAAAGARLLITAQEGDTLEELAGLAGAPLERLVELNPDLEGTEPLPAGREVFAPLPLGSPPTAPPVAAPTPHPPSGPAQPISGASPSKVSLWLRKRVLAPARPPQPPLLTAVVQDCDVQLFVADKATGEQGFFVYRLAPGAERFERIATLAANNGTLPLQYTDRVLGGHVEYYVSSFNAAGEAPSNVYGVDVSGPACLAPEWRTLASAGGELWLEGGRLVLSQPVDRVYYYLALDHEPWARVPADPQEFILALEPSELSGWAGQAGSAGSSIFDDLSGGGRWAFDLGTALGRMPALEGEHVVAVEVWGWRGGELLRLLAFDRAVRGSDLADARLWLSSNTRLSVCSEGGGCREGSEWADEATVPWDDELQAIELSWSTDAPGATGAVWQLSSKPFGQAFEPSPPGLVAAGALSGGHGTFRLDLAALVQPPLEQAASMVQARAPASSVGNGQPLSLVFGGLRAANPGPADAGYPRTYYVRVTPMAGNQQAGAPSGTVAIGYGPSEEGSSMVLPPPAGIYELHIAEFRPVVFPRSELWGCVRITRNDRYSGETDPSNPDPWSAIPAGTVICPEVYEGEGVQPRYQQLWDAAKGESRGAAEPYGGSEDIVAQVMAPALPQCDDGCRANLSMGLGAGLAAAGLPARLSSLDALTERGEAYLVGLMAAQAGAGCGEDGDCSDAIEQGLGALKEVTSGGGYNAACTSVEEAHKHGREPLCLPPGVVGVPVEGSEYVPATLVVQVTRRPQPAAVPESDYGRYVLHVSATASNASLVGQSIVAPFSTYVVDGVYAEEETEGQLLSIDRPLEGELFARVEQALPRLRPGETLMLPVELTASTYWLPGHAEMVAQMGGYVHYDDWFRLYSQGRATFRAAVDCYATTGWKNCGVDGQGWDELQVDLPAIGPP